MNNDLILFINVINDYLNAFFIFSYYIFIHFTKNILFFEQTVSFSENNSSDYNNYLEMTRLENVIQTDYLYLNPYSKFSLSKRIINLENNKDEIINDINFNFHKNFLNKSKEQLFIVCNNKNYYFLNNYSSIDKYNFFEANHQELFIFIEYVHPKMNNIQIDLPIEMFNNNNVLFTPSFVKWFLDSCNPNYVFDMDYKINFVDTNLENFTIDSTQYIKITENSYEVIKNEQNHNEQSEDEQSDNEQSDDEQSEDEQSEDEQSEDEQCEDEQCEDEQCEDEQCEDEQCEDEQCEDEQCENEQCEDQNKKKISLEKRKHSWFW
jgi:hypothetical protein